jgi:phenylalanyl-tRNA synthetase beta chain
MKISMEWLKEMVDLPEDLAVLRQELSLAGLVVESVTESGGSPVFEFEITSNRPDCLSHIGIAREIAALYNREVRMPELTRNMRIKKERIPFSIEIKDAVLCPRYVGLVLDSVAVGPSPDWMQRRLEAAGMRPVNNVVDITNYVLLERGHPLHAFDYDRLAGGRIVVDRAGAGQKFFTLDGIERELDDRMLMIQDGGGPVAIAGVMGGQNSEIGANTTRVLLECAYFQPASIRRTSRKLGLSTEASYRFERGADWNGTVDAIARTCHLLRQLAGARIAGSLQDVCPTPLEPVRIPLELKRAEALLGVSLTPEFIETTLKRLNFKPVRKGRGRWLVQCPSYRADMELEADLFEEIARFFGYQNIPTTVTAGSGAGRYSPVFECEQTTRAALLGLGYSETMNLSFSGADEDRLFPHGKGANLEISNPLTEDTRLMRALLAPGLVRAARHNFHHDQRAVRLFEIGKIFYRNQGAQVVERNTLGILGTGGWSDGNWCNPDPQYGFYHLKGALTSLLKQLHCVPFDFRPAVDCAWLDDTNAAEMVVESEVLGILGRLHPQIEAELKLKQPVYVAEIDLQGLMPRLFAPVRHDPLPRFPSAERDISFVVSKAIAYGELRRSLLALGIRELSSIDLMDVYEGDRIPAGKVSLTLRLVFRDREGTLTVDRVQGFSDNVRSMLRDRFDAENR